MNPSKFVKVVGIRKDTLCWGFNGESDFEIVELIEQIGWWMNNFAIKIYSHQMFYNTIQIGDKLSIITNQNDEVESVRSEFFNECPNCSAYYKDIIHECSAQNDSIKLDGESKILAVYYTGLKTKLVIKHINFPFEFSSILPYTFEFKVGEEVTVEGWYKNNTEEISVVVNKKVM